MSTRTDTPAAVAHPTRPDQHTATRWPAAAGGGLASWSIKCLHQRGTTFVILQGDIDFEAAPTLHACLLDGLDRNTDIVVDLADTTLLDCACLGVLHSAGRRADAIARTITLTAPQPTVRKVLRITHVDTIFTVLPDRHEVRQLSGTIAASALAWNVLASTADCAACRLRSG